MKHFRQKSNSWRLADVFSKVARVGVLFLFLSVGEVLFAAESYSQTKLSVNMKNATLKDVFREIERGSEFIIFYNDDAVDADRKVTVSADGATVSEILDDVLDPATTGYRIADRQVVIFRKEAAPAPAAVPAVQPQQEHVVSGTVTDADGQPLVGAMVSETGTSTGVIVDQQGQYTITPGSGNATLAFSLLGYQSIEVPVNGRTTIDITLEQDVSMLEDVVVVAYGTQRRSSISGSLTVVQPNKLSATATNIQSMLQGQVAGMNVSQSSGQPGGSASIVIHGRGSISSEIGPLWIVDGVVGGTTSSLNPNDIESVTVLKDGSATALYGSRGANGAIVVTTKKARLGDNAVDVSVKLGVTSLSRGHFRMMNSQELYDYTAMMIENRGRNDYPWFSDKLLGTDTDWFKLGTQNALTQNYNVSYRTGTDKVRSYTAVDYYNEDGTLRGYNWQRYNLRNNLTYKFNERLSINSSISGNYSKTDNRQRSFASLNLPWDSPYNSLGEVKTGNEGNDVATGKPMTDYWFTRDANNYLYDNQMNWSAGDSFGIDAQLGFDYTIAEGLVFTSTNNFGYSHSFSKSYTDPNSMGGMADKGSLYNSNSNRRRTYTIQQLSYAKVFDGGHDLNTVVAHEYSDEWFRDNSLTGKGIPQGGIVAGTASEPKSIDGDEYYNDRRDAWLFKANYAFRDTYFAEVSFRRDGSSKFGRNNRYGNFWSVGGGWNIHRERWMASLDRLDQLRLRGSYGITGNAPGGTFYSIYKYDISREYDHRPGAFPIQMGNPDMSWETTQSTNLGLDFRVFDRVSVITDFYVKNTSGLLYNRILSTLSGYEGVWLNDGRLKNMGVDVEVRADVVRTADWLWNVNFNVGYNKNEIKSLAEGKQLEISGNQIRQVGYPLGTYYTREWGGVDSATGAPTWVKVDENGNRSWVINQADANPHNLGITRFPDLQGGIQTDLSYRNISLGASFAFATGFYINHFGRTNYDNDGAEPQYNSMVLHKGWSRWEKPGDMATHPRPMAGGNNEAQTDSSRYFERGDFFKMKSLYLSYDIPAKWVGGIGMRSARLGLSVDNLFTITGFSGVDPELSMNGDSYVATSYPLPRKFILNLSLGF